MNKIREIVSAWATSFSPSDEQKRIAEIRYETCTTCEFKTNSVAGIEICGACGCPLKAKIFTPRTPEQGNCPKSFWKY